MDLDFLDGETPADTNTPVSDEAAGQPRDEHGRFAPVEATAAPEPAAQPATPEPAATPAAPVAEAAPEPAAPAAPAEAAATPAAVPAGFVPISVVQELRKEVQQLRQLAPQAQPEPAPVEIPDPFEDPDGYHAYHQEQVTRQVKSATLNMSRMMAVQAHGEPAVTEALAWAAERAEVDPTFRGQSWNHHHPVDFAVAEYKRHQLMQQVGTDPDAYVRQRAAELGFVLAGQAPVQAAPAPAPVPIPTSPDAPPRSLASAPAAGGLKPGSVPAGPGNAFDATFS